MFALSVQKGVITGCWTKRRPVKHVLSFFGFHPSCDAVVCEIKWIPPATLLPSKSGPTVTTSTATHAGGSVGKKNKTKPQVPGSQQPLTVSLPLSHHHSFPFFNCWNPLRCLPLQHTLMQLLSDKRWALWSMWGRRKGGGEGTGISWRKRSERDVLKWIGAGAFLHNGVVHCDCSSSDDRLQPSGWNFSLLAAFGSLVERNTCLLLWLVSCSCTFFCCAAGLHLHESIETGSCEIFKEKKTEIIPCVSYMHFILSASVQPPNNAVLFPLILLVFLWKVVQSSRAAVCD